MATVSKLTLDVEVKGDRLKTLSSQLNDVNQNTKNLGRASTKTFYNMERFTEGDTREEREDEEGGRIQEPGCTKQEDEKDEVPNRSGIANPTSLKLPVFAQGYALASAVT